MEKTTQLEFRARDAVARCLIRSLIVPEIYFDAKWPSPADEVDVMAIDRAGSGDVHVVEIKETAKAALKAVPTLMNRPGQYRWIAFFASKVDAHSFTEILSQKPLLPKKGQGRIGVIEVIEMTGGDLGANIKVKAERFPGSYNDQVDEFKAATQPDVSIR